MSSETAREKPREGPPPHSAARTPTSGFPADRPGAGRERLGLRRARAAGCPSRRPLAGPRSTRPGAAGRPALWPGCGGPSGLPLGAPGGRSAGPVEGSAERPGLGRPAGPAPRTTRGRPVPTHSRRGGVLGLGRGRSRGGRGLFRLGGAGRRGWRGRASGAGGRGFRSWQGAASGGGSLLLRAWSPRGRGLCTGRGVVSAAGWGGAGVSGRPALSPVARSCALGPLRCRTELPSPPPPLGAAGDWSRPAGPVPGRAAGRQAQLKVRAPRPDPSRPDPSRRGRADATLPAPGLRRVTGPQKFLEGGSGVPGSSARGTGPGRALAGTGTWSGGVPVRSGLSRAGSRGPRVASPSPSGPGSPARPFTSPFAFPARSPPGRAATRARSRGARDPEARPHRPGPARPADFFVVRVLSAPLGAGRPRGDSAGTFAGNRVLDSSLTVLWRCCVRP